MEMHDGFRPSRGLRLFFSSTFQSAPAPSAQALSPSLPPPGCSSTPLLTPCPLWEAPRALWVRVNMLSFLQTAPVSGSQGGV